MSSALPKRLISVFFLICSLFNLFVFNLPGERSIRINRISTQIWSIEIFLLSYQIISSNYYEQNKKLVFVKTRDDTFVFVFLLFASFMHAGVPSPASIYKSLDHVFIARILSPSGAAQLGIKEIQYLHGRDLVAFSGWLDEDYARSSHSSSKSGPLSYTSIRTTDLKSRVQPEMQHRVNVTKTI